MLAIDETIVRGMARAGSRSRTRATDAATEPDGSSRRRHLGAGTRPCTAR